MLPFQWRELRSLLPVYVTMKRTIYQSVYSLTILLTVAGEVLGFENLVFSIFDFVHTLMEKNKFKGTVKKALPELIYYIILYMQMTEDQVRHGVWREFVMLY